VARLEEVPLEVLRAALHTSSVLHQAVHVVPAGAYKKISMSQHVLGVTNQCSHAMMR
jgi:hypothetical protein